MALTKNHFPVVLLFIHFFLFTGNTIRAASVILPKSGSIVPPPNAPNNVMRADVFVQLTVKEFTSLTGKRLTLIEKIFFKAVQKKMKRELKNRPGLLITDYYEPVKQKFKLDELWFILGIMIGPLAILFSMTSRRNKMSRKSAFLGFLIFLVWFGFLFVF